MSDDAGPVEFEELLGLVDQSGLGVLRFDDSLVVLLADTAAHRLLDRPPDGLVGRSVMEAFLDHQVERLVAGASAGRVGAYESGSGDERRLLVRARPASAGGAWVALEDVTELRRLQRMRTEFIDNLSHELRTPLSNVRLLAEMLQSDLAGADVPQRIRERVATIDVETGHLAQMVDELLDLSRIEQASSPVRQDTTALDPIVTAAVGRVRPFAERQGVELRVRVPGDLPPIRGDEERLVQLLVNLLHNAIKFSSAGGMVTITAEEHPDSAVIAVADEGEGIPTEDQARVFERFYKVDRARHRGQGGTGLGLAIARHIVEAHGGTIWLESTEGAGSTFSFSVPFA